MRIYFTGADIGRTRLNLNIDPPCEIINSVRLLRHGANGSRFDTWRKRLRNRASRDRALRAALGALLDFAGAAPSSAALPRELAGAVQVYYQAAIKPCLPEIEDALRADSAGRAHTYVRGGAEAVLAKLNPVTTWKHPVLTFDNAGNRELFLGGRGLLLVPGYFCPPSPVAFVGPRPRLVYPMSWLDDASRTRGDHLAALLGNTRATILRSVVDGCTATELARRTGVTPATVCHHTAVLRNAGLIITRRQGTFTTHLIAPLGLRLLTG